MSKILVIGGKKSGVYAALLAKKKGNEVFLSESSSNEEVRELTRILNENGIDYEVGKHSFDRFLKFDFAVLSPGVPMSAPPVVYLKDHGISFIGEMEFAFQNAPGTKVIAVTGTNGKSTTTALTGHLLSDLNVVTGGNLGTPFSALLLENENPDFAVLETSCFQLETIDKYHPHVSVFLNISENHLDRYASIDEYISVKKRIFTNQTMDDHAVLNFDDVVVRKFISELHSKVWGFSVSSQTEYGAYLDKDGFLVFSSGSANRKIINKDDIPLIGMHNVKNALAAISVAMILGVPAESIEAKLRTFKGLSHRLEHVRTLDGVSYINDSKSTTPDSTITALEAFDSNVILIAGGSSKNNDFKPLAERLKGKVRLLVLIGATSQEIAEAAKREGFGDYAFASSLYEAVRIARAAAVSGDIVLLSPACASFDMFRDFEDRGDKFKEIVNLL